MATVVTAYVVVWFGVAVYVSWLGLEQRRTARRVQALETHLEGAAGAKRESPSQAA
jgi:CcmD family protein